LEREKETKRIEVVELLWINNNRKEKSLEELCLKFIEKYFK
jgi:hypothetical protein